MKAFILTALCALPLAAWGQPVFQREGKTLAELHTVNTDETVISAEADINIKMIDQGSSELNIIIGVEESDFVSAMNAIYKEFEK